MGFLGFHQFGTLLLLVSFGLLLTSTLTAPITRIALLKVSSPLNGDLIFGVFGWCKVIDGADDLCTKVGVGYELTSALNIIFGQEVVNTSLNKMTNGLLLHPISAAATLLAFLIAALSHRFGYIFAAVIAALAWILTLITLALDLALFIPARSKVLSSSSGASVSYGIGLWCTVGAAVLLLFAAIFTLFSLCTDRKEKRRSEGQVYSYVPQPAVVMPQMQPSHSYGYGKY